MPLEEAVEKAIDDCIKENVLRDFLTKQRAEVFKMSIYEYDEERELKLMLADERELGIQQGIQQGVQQGIQVVISMSKEQGSTREKTIELLMEKFCMNEKDAKVAVNSWWE